MTRCGSWEQFHTYIRWNHVPPVPPSVPMPAASPALAAGSVVVSSVALLVRSLRKRGP
jgi:hypothetical protein